MRPDADYFRIKQYLFQPAVIVKRFLKFRILIDIDQVLLVCDLLHFAIYCGIFASLEPVFHIGVGVLKMITASLFLFLIFSMIVSRFFLYISAVSPPVAASFVPSMIETTSGVYFPISVQYYSAYLLSSLLKQPY